VGRNGVPNRIILSAEVSSTANLASIRNAPDQAIWPIPDCFSHRLAYIGGMASGASILTPKRCRSDDLDRKVAESPDDYGANEHRFGQVPIAQSKEMGKVWHYTYVHRFFSTFNSL